MPERDITGRVTQGTVKRIARIRERMSNTIPYGPLREYLTSKESRLQLQNMDPNAKIALRQKMGDEEWNRMLERIGGS